MRLYLDDQECTFDGEQVGQAVTVGAAIADDAGRIVVDVVVDGESWSEDQLDDIADNTEIADEVRLISADPAALVHEAFGDAIIALEQADELQQEAAQQVQADAFSDAMDKLGDAMHIWQTVHRAVLEGTSLLGIDLEDISVGEQSAMDVVSALATQLQAIQAALTEQDPVGLSDALAYELPDVIAHWRTMIQQMRDGLMVEDAPED